MNDCKLFVNLNSVPEQLHRGLELLSSMTALSFEHRHDAAELRFTPGTSGIDICADDKVVNITYGDKTDAFRALGLVNARRNELKNLKIRAERRIDKVFVMLDASRNAVLNRESSVQWLCFMALAGINGFMFYTEDTFEVPGEELFGYLRGRLSCDELRALDDVADALGIEMMPCIQTLAHLQRILHYDRYLPIKDTESVMLCDSPETLEFIERIITAAVAPYRSKRIHIGMDEAWDLGRGAFLTKNGYHNPSDIMSGHLKQVMQIVRRMQLKPMIWADMFFRAINNGRYYPDAMEPQQVSSLYRDKVDADIDLIYWDYYRFDKEHYDRMIVLHEAINNRKPLVAPGIHAWGRFWTAGSHSMKTLTPCLESCFEHGTEEIIITIWGDDGTENDYFSTLPYLQYAADVIYSGTVDLEQTRINLQGSFGIDFDDWNYAAGLDSFGSDSPNITKTLMWEDPLIGLMQPQLDGVKLNAHYRGFADKLQQMLKKSGNERLDHPWRIADILADKADLPTLLREAYLAGDRAQLELILNQTVPMLIEKIRAQRDAHRKLWLKNYKPFGWDALERRYGGLIGCFENLQYRLKSYLNGDCGHLEELEAGRCRTVKCAAGEFPYVGHRQSVESTGYLFH